MRSKRGFAGGWEADGPEEIVQQQSGSEKKE